MSPAMHNVDNARTSRLSTGRVILFVLLAGGVAERAVADASHPKEDPALQSVLTQTSATSTVRVIVTAAAGKYSAMRTRVAGTKRKINAEHLFINALTAELGKADIGMLELDANTARISLDHTVLSTAVAVTQTAPPAPPIDATLLATLGLVNSKVTGKGVGVAILDSGLQTSTAVKPATLMDFTTGKSGQAPDGYGHGTHVAGLIGAFSTPANPLQMPMIGVAPGVRLFIGKVLDSTGRGNTSTLLTALEYLLNNRGTFGLDVVNLSLGHVITESASSDPLVQAIEALSRKNIVMVVAAGNLGENQSTGGPAWAGITSPGNAPSAITVGALDTNQTVTPSDDQVPTYSSRGPTWYDGFVKPDIVAPGHNLVSLAAVGSSLYTRYPALRVGDGTGVTPYMRLSGTSMATAVATGVAALLIEQHRGVSSQPLSPNDIKAVLQFTAIPMNADVLIAGAGEINPPGARAVVSVLTGSADPTMRSTVIVNPTTPIEGMTYSWGKTVIWGHSSIYGDTVYANEPAWTLQTTWGSAVVWVHSWAAGGDLVWDSAPTWSANTVWSPVVAPSTAGQTWSEIGAQAKTVIWGHGSGPY